MYKYMGVFQFSNKISSKICWNLYKTKILNANKQNVVEIMVIIYFILKNLVGTGLDAKGNCSTNLRLDQDRV